ncbi:hypothetical protein K439DRAFT_1421174 [Ramaria rubella]|nr:hypothetical protein K439DRAFT_1421174 [Ramaria rubella]
MSAGIPPHIKVDDTLGAALIGGLLTATLFGITLLQTFSYFQTFGNDPKKLKAFVFSVLLSDTAHMTLVAHSIYWYLITNYSNPEAITSLPTSIFAGIIVTNISDVAIRLFFSRRVWILSRGSKIITLPLVVLIIIIFISGFGFGVKSFQLATFSKLQSISWLLYTGFALALAGDVYIALTLCILLFTSRSGVRKTDSVVNILIAYTVNTGLITSVTSAVVVFTYVAMPKNFIFLASYFPLSKFYVNAMLATLNAREVLRNTSAAHGDTSSSLVYYSPRPKGGSYINESAPSSQTTYPLRGVGRKLESGETHLLEASLDAFARSDLESSTVHVDVKQYPIAP